MKREIWRLLEQGEKKQRTDEFIELNAIGAAWTSLDDAGFDMRQFDHCLYRRRETIEDEPKWFIMSLRKPQVEDGNFHEQVLFCSETGYAEAIPYYSHRSSGYWTQLPKLKKEDHFEVFWQTHKNDLVDIGKEKAKLLFEEARKNL